MVASVELEDSYYVPETFLKKRKLIEREEEIRQEEEQRLGQLRSERKEQYFKKAEEFVREYRMLEAAKNNLKKSLKNGEIYVEDQPRVAFVIRLKGINHIDPRSKSILTNLRLHKINSGVFVKLTLPIKKMLHLVQPYITYGHPTLRTIRDLVYKRGYAKVDKSRIRLNDNQIVEKGLGSLGMLCAEDIVHEIYTCGDNFTSVTNFLWPFMLSNPVGGFKGRKSRHYVQGGEAGDREQEINALVARMM